MGNSLKNHLKFQLKGRVTTSTPSVFISNDLERNQEVVLDNASVVLTNKNGSKVERCVVDASGGVMTFVKRGLDQSDTETEVPSLKKEWFEGQLVYVTYLSSQIIDKNSSNTFVGTQTFENLTVTNSTIFNGTARFPVYANNTARDTAIPSPSNGMIIYNTTAGVLQKYVSGAWVDDTVGSIANASTTVAGKVQESTISNLQNQDSTGSTGARLYINPSLTRKTSSGSSDADMVVRLGPDGKIDGTMLPPSSYQPMVLGEDMTAGSLSFMFNDTSLKLYKYLGYKGLSSNISGWVSSSSANTIDANAKIQSIGNNKFVVVYNSWNGSFDQVNVIVGLMTNQVITRGSPTPIGGISNTLQSISICEIDTEKFVVARKNSNTTTIETTVCTVSGLSISGNNTQTAITTSGTFLSLDISKVDTNKFAVFSNSASRQMVCATVSGTTATFGSVITPTITCDTLAQATANKIVGTDGSNIRIYTISGTTITEQANFAIGTTYTSESLCNYSTTSSYLIFSGTTGGNTEAFIVDASGTTATKGATLLVATGVGNNMCSKSVGTDIVVVSGSRNTHIGVSGTTLAIRKIITLPNSVIGYKSVTYHGIRNILSCSGNKNTQPTARSHNNTIKFLSGITQQTGITGNTVDVAMSGAVSKVHTGLLDGNPVYASDSDGSFSNLPSDVFVGLSSSPTNIVVQIPYSTL